ncbi:hypothetical protein Fcan01_26965 [Folsomia candida]|uniref:Uncharacterized protein n=1 Tax=Folsomia candida TaxID=158441 RepID=A0A226CZX4_FOLCA|nr:hypothetical protein Fcan01_26965 [Folsomia candida]
MLPNFSSFLLISSFILPIVTGSQYESLQNLDLYLSAFKSCLVHLINYRGINFNPFSHPVLTSRYDVVIIQREGYHYPEPIFFRHEDSPAFRSAQVAIAKLNESFISDELFLRYDEMLKVRWKLMCVVQFYVLPPEVDATSEGNQTHNIPVCNIKILSFQISSPGVHTLEKSDGRPVAWSTHGFYRKMVTSVEKQNLRTSASVEVIEKAMVSILSRKS